MKYDFLIVIGRIQPLHIGHVKTIKSALDKAEQVILLVGSSNISQSIKNPWTYDQRHDKMLCKVFDREIVDGRLIIQSLQLKLRLQLRKLENPWKVL